MERRANLLQNGLYASGAFEYDSYVGTSEDREETEMPQGPLDQSTTATQFCTRDAHVGSDPLPMSEFRWMPTVARYHNWCRECERQSRQERAQNPTRRRSVRRAPVVSQVPRSRAGRAFGVEIELTGPSAAVITAAIRAEGIEIADGVSGYGATNPTDSSRRWQLKRDGSVSGYGLELVSPKLRGEDGFDQLERVCRALNSVNATVDRSTGLHVHHDFSGLSFESMQRQLLGLIDAQGALFEMVAPSRRSNHYCPRIGQTHRDAIARATSLSDFHGYFPRGAVNVNAYPRHGSIEIRLHGGTTQFKKISAWVRLAQRIMDAAEVTVYDLSTMDARTLCRELNVPSDDADTLLRFVRVRETAEAALVEA